MQRQRKKDKLPLSFHRGRWLFVSFFLSHASLCEGGKAFPHFHTPCIVRAKTFRAISCLFLKLVENARMILMEILTLERRKLCCSSRENFIAFHLRKQIVINLMAWIIHLESDYGESSCGTHESPPSLFSTATTTSTYCCTATARQSWRAAGVLIHRRVLLFAKAPLFSFQLVLLLVRPEGIMIDACAWMLPYGSCWVMRKSHAGELFRAGETNENEQSNIVN